ncbi:MAG: hypothetical protein PHW87_13615, partial [Methanothrix sp.]|nr:hypothetical protein [Methanothrix sp.]
SGGGGYGSRAKWIVWEEGDAGLPQVCNGSNEFDKFNGCNAKTAPEPRRVLLFPHRKCPDNSGFLI